MQKPMLRKQWLAFAALGLIWGSTWIATDTLGENVPPLLGTATRFFLAALLLIPLVAWKRWPLPRGRFLAFVLLLSVTMIVVPTLLLVWAREHIPSVTVAVLYAAMPLVVMLMSPDVAAPRAAMNGAIVALGGMMLALSAVFSLGQTGAVAVVLLAVASTAASAVFARRELGTVHPAVTTALVLGAAAPLLFFSSLWMEHGQPAHWDLSAMIAVTFLAAVPGALAYAVWFWLLQHLQAYQVATVQWIAPLVALGEGAILFRMRWSSGMVAGVVLIIGSLWMVLRSRPEDDENVSLWSN